MKKILLLSILALSLSGCNVIGCFAFNHCQGFSDAAGKTHKIAGELPRTGGL